MCVWNYLNRGGRGRGRFYTSNQLAKCSGGGGEVSGEFVSQPINVFAALIPELIRGPQ